MFCFVLIPVYAFFGLFGRLYVDNCICNNTNYQYKLNFVSCWLSGVLLDVLFFVGYLIEGITTGESQMVYSDQKLHRLFRPLRVRYSKSLYRWWERMPS